MKLDKAIQTLGKETIEEMDAMGEHQLTGQVVSAERAMRDAKDELEQNRSYLQAKGDLQVLTAPLKEINARQKAKIAYSLFRLSELGKG